MHHNIAIIGAGISGLSTAYYLEKAGFFRWRYFKNGSFKWMLNRTSCRINC